jgi:putative hemolysin
MHEEDVMLTGLPVSRSSVKVVTRFAAIIALAMSAQLAVAVPPPGGGYCKEMGYTLERGICRFPDGNTCGLWNFYRGECGRRWSYCEQHGGRVKARTEDRGASTHTYAVCLFEDGSECAEQAFLTGECQPGECARWSGSECAKEKNEEAAEASVKVALKADSGKYMARCNNCIPGGAYPDSAFVHAESPKPAYAQWILKRLSRNGKYSIQSADSKKFAARCNNCIPGGAYPDSAFVHADTPRSAYAQWILKRLSNGKYSIQSADSKKFAARCNNCVPGAAYPDNVFVHATDPEKEAWAQWEIITLP